MGDAGIEKEKDILEKYNISDVYVLKVGHHGSKTSSGKEFINEINPWAFTMGSALFTANFVPHADFRTNLIAVIEYMNQIDKS